MPQGIAQVRPVDPVLNDFGMEYRQSLDIYAADAMFPWNQTEGDTGTYYVADALNNLRWEDGAWSHVTGATRVMSKFTSAAYLAQPYGWEEPVYDAWVRNWMAPGQGLKERATATVTDKALLARERRVYTIATAVAPTVSLASTAKWNSTASNPRADITTGQAAIRKRIGAPGNSGIISGSVVDSILGTQLAGSAGAAIAEMVKYTQKFMGSDLTEALLQQYFNLDMIRFARAIMSDSTKYENTTVNANGLPEAGTYIWADDEFYLVRRDSGPQGSGFGQTFGPDMNTIDTYRDDKVKADIVRCTQTLTEKTTCSNSIYVLGTIL